MTTTDIRPAWLVAAYDDLGVHEQPGPIHNKRVLEMFKMSGHPEVKDDETAWCAAAVNSWLFRAGLRGTQSLWALAFLGYGTKLLKPALGCIGVKQRTNSEGKVIGGHVFLVVGADASNVFALGGNQSDQVCITTIPKSAIKGYRWPTSFGAIKVPPPTDAQYVLPKTSGGAKKAGQSEA